MKRKRLHTILSLMLLTVLTACFGSDPEDNRNRLHVFDTNITSNESMYKLFEYENRDIAIESSRDLENVPHADLNHYEQILYREDPPDVLVLPYTDYVELMDKQLLMPIDAYLSESDWDETDFVPGILDGLRSGADNQLYGLSTNFSSRVLLYNKTLFDEADLPYPTDGVTWDEVFENARELAQDDPNERVYGFQWRWSYSHLYQFPDLLSLYAPPLGMTLFDNGEMTVDTDDWKKLWETLISLTQEGVFLGSGQFLYEGDIQGPLNLFLVGKLAMTTISYRDWLHLNELDQYAHLIPYYEPIEWGIAPMPGHAENPEVVGGIELEDIIVIHAKSENANEAWRLVEFYVNQRSQTQKDMISVFQNDKMDAEVSHFYPADFALHPQYSQSFYSFSGHNQWIQRLLNEGDRLFQRVLNDETTIEQALRDWQRGGNTLLR